MGGLAVNASLALDLYNKALVGGFEPARAGIARLEAAAASGATATPAAAPAVPSEEAVERLAPAEPFPVGSVVLICRYMSSSANGGGNSDQLAPLSSLSLGTEVRDATAGGGTAEQARPDWPGAPPEQEKFMNVAEETSEESAGGGALGVVEARLESTGRYRVRVLACASADDQEKGGHPPRILHLPGGNLRQAPVGSSVGM